MVKDLPSRVEVRLYILGQVTDTHRVLSLFQERFIVDLPALALRFVKLELKKSWIFYHKQKNLLSRSRSLRAKFLA